MIFSGVSWLAFSQQDPVVMRVNGKDVLRSEFEYYYNKDAASFASGYVAPEKYAERFADFKYLLPRRPVWIRLFRFVRRLKITAIG